MRLNQNNNTSIWLYGIILLSVVGQFILLLIYRHLNLPILQSDSHSYLAPANALLQHHVLWSNATLWMRTPGYPLFIAFIFSLFGHHIVAISIAQILLSPLLIWNAFRIARFFTNIRMALIVAFVVACDHLYLFSSLYILTDYIFAVLMSFVFYYSIKLVIDKNVTLRPMLGLGMLLAIATLLRPIGYYLVPLLAIVGVIYLIKHKGIKFALVGTLMFLIPSVILIGGWQLRNKQVIGSYQYSGISSSTIYRFYAADVIAHRDGISFEAAQARLDQKAKAMHFKTSVALNHYYQKEGVHILLSHPKLSIMQGAYGFVRMMFGVLSSDIVQINQGSTLKTKFNKLLTGLYLVLNIVLFVSLLLFIIESVSRNNHKAAVLLTTLISFYFCMVSSNYCSYARFRLPFNLMLDVFGVLGLAMLAKKFVSWRQNAKAAACYQ